MKSIIAACILAITASVAAFADPIYVIRPALSSKKVLPQTAFGATTPATPPVTTPPPTTTPAPSTVFTSTGYGANLPVRSVSQSGQREYHTPGSSDGVYYCAMVDDSGKTLSKKMTFTWYPGSGTNTPAILLNPLVKGLFKLVLTCGESKAKSVPVEKFEVTVN